MQSSCHRILIGIAASAALCAPIANAQWTPLKRCSMSCGNPPQEIGAVICAVSQDCCHAANCPTGEYAGVCCEYGDCCNGFDTSNNNMPFANCNGPDCEGGVS